MAQNFIVIILTISLSIIFCATLTGAAPSAQPINADRISQSMETDSKQYIDKSDFYKIYPKYTPNNNQTTVGTTAILLIKKPKYDFKEDAAKLELVSRPDMLKSMKTNEVDLNNTGGYLIINEKNI